MDRFKLEIGEMFIDFWIIYSKIFRIEYVCIINMILN